MSSELFGKVLSGFPHSGFHHCETIIFISGLADFASDTTFLK